MIWILPHSFAIFTLPPSDILLIIRTSVTCPLRLTRFVNPTGRCKTIVLLLADNDGWMQNITKTSRELCAARLSFDSLSLRRFFALIGVRLEEFNASRELGRSCDSSAGVVRSSQGLSMGIGT